MHAHWHLKLLCIYKTVDIVGTSLTWFTKRPYYRQLAITGTEWIVLATFRLAFGLVASVSIYLTSKL